MRARCGTDVARNRPRPVPRSLSRPGSELVHVDLTHESGQCRLFERSIGYSSFAWPFALRSEGRWPCPGRFGQHRPSPTAGRRRRCARTVGRHAVDDRASVGARPGGSQDHGASSAIPAIKASLADTRRALIGGHLAPADPAREYRSLPHVVLAMPAQAGAAPVCRCGAESAGGEAVARDHRRARSLARRRARFLSGFTPKWSVISCMSQSPTSEPDAPSAGSDLPTAHRRKASRTMEESTMTFATGSTASYIGAVPSGRTPPCR
jgi:hypothetical protein